MAVTTFGTGTSTGPGTLTTSLYTYTPFQGSYDPCLWDGGGLCTEIKFYNGLNNGQCKVWTGTWSGNVFSFASYTDAANVDLTGKGTGAITLTAPTDFTAFPVNKNEGMIFYCSSVTTDGTQYGRETTGQQFYGFHADDPVYSSNIQFDQGTTGRLSISATGITLGKPKTIVF